MVLIVQAVHMTNKRITYRDNRVPSPDDDEQLKVGDLLFDITNGYAKRSNGASCSKLCSSSIMIPFNFSPISAL
jgi:hypothetical protein